MMSIIICDNSVDHDHNGFVVKLRIQFGYKWLVIFGEDTATSFNS